MKYGIVSKMDLEEENKKKTDELLENIIDLMDEIDGVIEQKVSSHLPHDFWRGVIIQHLMMSQLKIGNSN